MTGVWVKRKDDMRQDGKEREKTEEGQNTWER